MKFKAVLASAFAMLSLTACEDLFEGGSLQPDGSKPDLVIKAPMSNQSFTKAQGVPLILSIVDKDEVKDLEVIIKSANSETELTRFHLPTEKSVVELDTILTAASYVAGTYNLTVNVTDKRTNFSTKQVQFVVK
ncbi:hypothetical protein [Pontibacter ruber]|uniref:DUF4625 domain-containing protein n=1 Tax=Pontibacter ruber TaxID=1343895 RepID=A0ABW5CW64_9BACT|nr:hypothetical protein [Pontibacter ruber]